MSRYSVLYINKSMGIETDSTLMLCDYCSELWQRRRHGRQERPPEAENGDGNGDGEPVPPHVMEVFRYTCTCMYAFTSAPVKCWCALYIYMIVCLYNVPSLMCITIPNTLYTVCTHVAIMKWPVIVKNDDFQMQANAHTNSNDSVRALPESSHGSHQEDVVSRCLNTTRIAVLYQVQCMENPHQSIVMFNTERT